jgi:hypothetical protein
MPKCAESNIIKIEAGFEFEFFLQIFERDKVGYGFWIK